MNKPVIRSFFDEATFTVTYVVSDPATSACAVIDSVLDYDPASGRTATRSADAVLAYVAGASLKIEWILDTHVHADHLTAADYLKRKAGGLTGIGDHVPAVQSVFSGVFNVGAEFPCDGSQFDRLFAPGEEFSIGSLTVKALHAPGHTPACVMYVIGDAVFVGDTLFMPDYGTARCDFPGGDSRQLYQSIQRLFAMPNETRLFLCHDYKAPGRDAYVWETTVGEQRAHNIHIKDGISEDAFVIMREARDAELAMPMLILPSVQINMRAGQMPPAEDNGTVYLKMPLDMF
ncbi:MAG: MBL fold metallo-hydrolase [Rhodospirillales bacterium]|nr:MBL fold metallo-hydrolase [Rhodospirillales bacterium]